MNATCERLADTLRRELLDQTLILGEQHLLAVLDEYQTRRNTARRVALPLGWPHAQRSGGASGRSGA